MNRKIKFRMKDKQGEWQYVEMTCSIIEALKDPVTPGGIDIDENTIGQYTGIDDKNGKEIYEGDAWEDEDGYYIIVWDEKEAGFLVDTYGIEEWLGEGGQECYGNKIEFISREPIDYFNFSKIEIIKNIYDNPELLGGE